MREKAADRSLAGVDMPAPPRGDDIDGSLRLSSLRLEDAAVTEKAHAGSCRVNSRRAHGATHMYAHLHRHHIHLWHIHTSVNNS